nr:4-hydroxyphenylpyruvate dioxygenase [Aliterella atlantica]
MVMKIDRVHFYVEDAQVSRDWFVNRLGFQSVASSVDLPHTRTELVKSGAVYFALSSPSSSASPVAKFLSQHPPGVADISFCVDDVEAITDRAIARGAKVLHQSTDIVKIAAWGALTHTLVEDSSRGAMHCTPTEGEIGFSGIDHVVLNVAQGDLEMAVAWYENMLDFQAQQTFKIQTDRSALHSQVMVSRNKQVQLPINQPASSNSQIQEFLDVNKGAGIQHIALETPSIVQAIAHFRAFGVDFLPVPPSYYTQLLERPGLPLSAREIAEIAEQQILVDWQETLPQALLLQTFTQPIFGEPTFFLEIIERRSQARGFGEGNFRALFEAIEREQLKRGSMVD